MEKRAELLEDLQKSSDVVLNSNRFDNVEQMKPDLLKFNQEIRDGFETLLK